MERVKEEARAAKEGEAEHSPFAVLGGVGLVVGIVVGLVILAALLVWWLA